MEAKEKAKELFNKYADNFNFDDTYRGYEEQSKQCALIAVDEILNVIDRDMNYQNVYSFYLEVKTEIELL